MSKISTKRAFSALNSGRKAQSRARYNFVVKSVNKDGSISRAQLTDSDWQLNAFVTEAEAQKRAEQLESMNPGRRFAVCPL